MVPYARYCVNKVPHWGLSLPGKFCQRDKTSMLGHREIFTKVKPALAMGHYNRNQYGQNEQSPEPSGSHHYRTHEVDTHTRARDYYWTAAPFGSLSWEAANTGCQIQKAQRSPNGKKNVSANKRKTKEGKLCPPKQMSWTKTQRHSGTKPPKDFPMPWDPCLEQRKTFPCQKRLTRNRSQRLTEWSDEEIDQPGTPSTVLPQGNLDLHLHRWLSGGHNMQWWSGCICKVPRWHRW